MEIREVFDDRRKFWPLLLDADPDRRMVERYLDLGFMLAALENGVPVGECVVVPAVSGWEVKNLAVAPALQRRGIGRALLAEAERRIPAGTALWVGTSDAGVGFYERCGFVRDHILPGFFTKNYPEPIYENGAQCVDMVYLQRTARKEEEGSSG